MKNPPSLRRAGMPSQMFNRAHRYHVLLVLMLLSSVSFAQVELVKDIDTSHDPLDREYREAVEFDGFLVFATRNELWRSGGLSGNTYMIKRFQQIRELIVFKGQLYFAADDGSGLELWRSGGASYNTKRVKDINPGTGGSAPHQFTTTADLLYFVATTPANGTEVWKTDGTTAGTTLLRDIINRGGSSNPDHLESANGHLLFAANDGIHGYELWRSDGTTAGTHMLIDLKTGSRLSSSPRDLTNVNDVIYFTADDGVSGRELWKTDGTEMGTMQVKDLISGPAGTHYDNLTNVNGALFFSANDKVHGEELWRSNGTPESTFMVKDLTPGKSGSGVKGAFSPAMTNFTDVNGRLYFTAHFSGRYYFWKSDGTEAGTLPILPVNEIGITQLKARFIHYRDNVYFVNGGRISEQMAMTVMRESSDGVITTVTQLLMNDYYETESPFLVTAGNFLFFPGRLNFSEGHSLFVSNGTPSGTRQIADALIVRNQGSDPAQFLKVAGEVYFITTFSDNYYRERRQSLWKTDGTPDGTLKIITLRQIRHLTEYNGQVVFSGLQDSIPRAGWDIYRSDGTPSGTVRFNLDHLGSPPNESIPTDLAVLGDKIFYTADFGSLWVTEGSAPTQLSSGNYARIHGVAGNQLFFIGTDATHGRELWRTNGTTTSTRMVEDINPGTGSSFTDRFTSRAGIAYFVAYEPVHGYELWRSNGTSAGTYLIKDLRTADTDINRSLDIGIPVSTTEAVYFITAGGGLWKTDGTAAGTLQLNTVPVAGEIYASRDRIYVETASSNPVLWKSDGTPESTIPIKEISPIASFHRPATVTVGDVFYFASIDGSLWRTDGTSCGTYPVEGTSNAPSPLSTIGNTLIFGYDDTSIGRELFKLDLETITDPGCETYATALPSTEVRNELKYNIKNHPNPFTQTFLLNVAGDYRQTYAAEIIDLRGSSVESRTELPYQSDQTFGAELPPGMYFLKVRETGRLTTIKIIKQ